MRVNRWFFLLLSVCLFGQTDSSPLLSAIFCGEVARVHRWVAQEGTPIERAYPGDWAHLSVGIKAGQVEVWDEVRRGDALAAGDADKQTPMTWTWLAFGVAAVKGDSLFFEGCRRAGISIPEAPVSQTPLHHPLVRLAASFGQTDLLDYFLANKTVPIPPRGQDLIELGGMTIMETDPVCFRKFLAWEAHHPALAGDPYGLAYLAAKFGLTGELEVLLQERKAKIRLDDTLVSSAANEGNWTAVRMLLRAGAGTKRGIRFVRGESSFWQYVGSSKLSGREVAELILLDVRNLRWGPAAKNDTFILWDERLLGDPALVQRLLDAGIERQAFVTGSSSGLEGPVISGAAHPDVLAMLLKWPLRGIDEIGPYEGPPIACTSSPIVARALLDLGARLEWRGPDGRLHLLLHHFLDKPRAHPERLYAFLDSPRSNEQLNRCDAEGRLPLGIAAGLRNPPQICGTGYDSRLEQKPIDFVSDGLVFALLKKGARPDRPDRNGVTAFEIAARYGPARLDALLRWGPKPSPRLVRRMLDQAFRDHHDDTLLWFLDQPSMLDARWPWEQWAGMAIDMDHVVSHIVEQGFLSPEKRLALFNAFRTKDNADALSKRLGVADH